MPPAPERHPASCHRGPGLGTGWQGREVRPIALAANQRRTRRRSLPKRIVAIACPSLRRPDQVVPRLDEIEQAPCLAQFRTLGAQLIVLLLQPFSATSYVPLFAALTSAVSGERTVFYNSVTPPSAPGCKLVKFATRRRTNWQYQCAAAFLRGDLATVI